MRFKHQSLAALISCLVMLAVPALVFAASTPNLTQTINAGVLSTDILDASRNPVASPSFALGTANFSFNCQTVTGTFGSNTQRIYASNPNADSNGFTLALAATSGATSTWSAGTPKYDFNDPTAGCGDSADTDTVGGQLTVDPSVSTITTDCGSCTATGITKGSSTAFNQGTTDSVTLLNAAAASDDVGRWYLTGANLSQTIPAESAVGSYSLGMTLTITGL